MKPTLQFRLSQHLTLTPQLQQSIRLLQLSTVELNQEIERLLMENPILEREDGEGDAAAAGAGAPERGAPRPQARRTRATAASERAERARAEPAEDWRAARRLRGALARRRGRRRRRRGRPHARRRPTRRRCATTSTSELALTNLGERDRALVALLIDVLDDDGYLTQPLEEIAALMSAEAEVDVEELGHRAAPPAEPRARRASARARRANAWRCRSARCEGDAAPRLRARRRDRRASTCELLASRDYARLKSLTGARATTRCARRRS